MNKAIKIGGCLLVFAFVLCAVFLTALFIHNNRVVATTNGNKIYYNNETYVESFEVFDFEIDKCIGRVDFTGSKSKMYSIREMSDYIFVSMDWDYRIYKKVSKYSENDFIGKTSAEIVNEFGLFDCVGMPASEDGLYRNCRCGYTIKDPQKRFFGSSPEILFFIIFDENGIAIASEEGYRPGG